jgi:extracellular elastinolytic metalloproteinase
MRRLIALLASLCALAAPAAAHAVVALDRIGPADGNLDLRDGASVAPRDPAAVAALRSQLGAQGVVAVDSRTGGLRMVGRLDGFLTAASSADAADVALGFVRANLDAFGLTAADVDNLVLVRRTATVGGIQRLFWQQRARGVPSLDSGLRANVAADGRLINVVGSPSRGVRSATVAPRISPTQARAAALRAVGTRVAAVPARRSFDARATTVFANGDRAALGVLAAAGNRVAWETVVRADDGRTYRAVVDAASGETLFRRTLTQNATARVHRNFPGAAAGGTRDIVTFPADWIAPGAMTLTGPYAHAFADLNDSQAADGGEEAAPLIPDVWDFGLFIDLTQTGDADGTALCGVFICTWNAGNAPATRAQNRRQATTEAFFLVSNFHDWLEAAPFGFTAANGGFETTDPVDTQVLDGASTGPDNDHIDNANMSTPPDGTSPTMQMYLFHTPGAPTAPFPGGDPFLPSSGADDAGIVYHEYVHGLSNRLVVDSLGNSTLNSHQAGSMGEAWSDFYAMDYLADTVSCLGVACEPDTVTPGELLVGE